MLSSLSSSGAPQSNDYICAVGCILLPMFAPPVASARWLWLNIKAQEHEQDPNLIQLIPHLLP